MSKNQKTKAPSPQEKVSLSPPFNGVINEGNYALAVEKVAEALLADHGSDPLEWDWMKVKGTIDSALGPKLVRVLVDNLRKTNKRGEARYINISIIMVDVAEAIAAQATQLYVQIFTRGTVASSLVSLYKVGGPATPEQVVDALDIFAQQLANTIMNAVASQYQSDRTKRVKTLKAVGPIAEGILSEIKAAMLRAAQIFSSE